VFGSTVVIFGMFTNDGQFSTEFSGSSSSVLDGIQSLCEVAGVPPCILDASIFASYDTGWTAENIV
jgi:hypothetical protein